MFSVIVLPTPLVGTVMSPLGVRPSGWKVLSTLLSSCEVLRVSLKVCERFKKPIHLGLGNGNALVHDVADQTALLPHGSFSLGRTGDEGGSLCFNASLLGLELGSILLVLPKPTREKGGMSSFDPLRARAA